MLSVKTAEKMKRVKKSVTTKSVTTKKQKA